MQSLCALRSFIAMDQMKSAILVLGLSLLVLCGFTKSLALGDDVGEPVGDSEGHAVVAGADYHMLVPFVGHDGGEFAPGKTSNMTCPLSVVLDLATYGELVRISPTTGNKGIVFTNESVEISFSKKIECAESSKWMIVKESGEDFWSVGLGSARDHPPGTEILSGSFKIQKSDVYLSHTFMFCPNINATSCGYIQGSNRLILMFGSDTAFDFVLRPKPSILT